MKYSMSIKKHTSALMVVVLGLAAATLVTFAPGVPLLALVLGLIFIFPAIGISIGILQPSVALPFILANDDISLITIIGTISMILALIVLFVQSQAVRTRLVKFALPIIAILSWGLIVGVYQMPLEQVLIGVRFFFIPFLIAVGAVAIEPIWIKRILTCCGVVLLINVPVLIWERTLGADGLMALGLTYGESVRTVDSVLRPPGTFAANYELGAFAAVYSTLQMALLATSKKNRTTFGYIFLFSAITAVLLSTARFAIVIVVVAAVAIAVTRRQQVSPILRLVTLVGGTSVVGMLLLKGSTGTESLFARLDLWESRWGDINLWIGNGWGSSGASTLSESSVGRMVMDNYYLSLLYQLGALGGILAFVAWVLVLRQLSAKTVSHRSEMNYAGLISVVAVLVSFIVTETWEYSGAICLLMLCLGSTRGGRETAQPEGAVPSAG